MFARIDCVHGKGDRMARMWRVPCVWFQVYSYFESRGCDREGWNEAKAKTWDSKTICSLYWIITNYMPMYIAKEKSTINHTQAFWNTHTKSLQVVFFGLQYFIKRYLMGQVLPVAFSYKGKKLVAIVLPYTCDGIRWDPLLFQCLALVCCRNCVGHHSCQDWRSARASCLKVSLFIALHAGCSILFSTVAVDDVVQGEEHWTTVENSTVFITVRIYWFSVASGSDGLWWPLVPGCARSTFKAWAAWVQLNHSYNN